MNQCSELASWSVEKMDQSLHPSCSRPSFRWIEFADFGAELFVVTFFDHSYSTDKNNGFRLALKYMAGQLIHGVAEAAGGAGN